MDSKRRQLLSEAEGTGGKIKDGATLLHLCEDEGKEEILDTRMFSRRVEERKQLQESQRGTGKSMRGGRWGSVSRLRSDVIKSVGIPNDQENNPRTSWGGSLEQESPWRRTWVILLRQNLREEERSNVRRRQGWGTAWGDLFLANSVPPAGWVMRKKPTSYFRVFLPIK